MKQICDIFIAGLPPTINAIGRKHWAVKNNIAKRWKALVTAHCNRAQVSNLRLEKCSIEFTRYSSRETDFDNLASSFKHILDGLVHAEVIIDDKSSIIGSPTFIWQKAKQKEGMIRIRIFTD